MTRQYSQLLSNKLLMVSLLSVLVVSIVLTTVVGYMVLDHNRSLILSNQKTFTDLVANRIDNGLRERLTYLQELSSRLVQDESLLSPNDLKAQLDAQVAASSLFNNGVIVVNAEGIVVQDSPELPGRIGLDVNDRDYYQRVQQTQTPLITEPLFGRAAQSPIFLMIQPIMNHAQQGLGYLFGSIRLADDNLMINISNETIGDQGNLWVFDLERDLVVASSNKALAMQPISSLGKDALISALKQQEFQGEVVISDKQKILYTATPMQVNAWLIVHSFPADLILSPVKTLLQQMFLILALMTVVVGIVTLLIIRHLVKPLKTSAEQIEELLSSPDAISSIPIQRYDEVGILVSAFNQLLEKQKIQARQLAKEKLRAEAASQAKSDFLANMSHEIRTPLNAIIGLSELQESTHLPDEFIQRNEQILRSGRLLLAIVNDLLDFSKIESGKMDFHEQPFAVDELIEQLSILFSNQARLKGLELHLDVDNSLPNVLIGDSLRLTQILTNLLSNAIKFTEKGCVSLSVRAISAEKQQVWVSFSVIDTGIGISEEQRKMLFTSFSQADSSITRRHGGTGLGLAISQRLVELLGGQGIDLETEPNVGSVFQFRLRFALVEGSHSLTDSHEVFLLNNSQESTELARFSGQSVLVVEDHPVNQQMVKAQLEKMGLSVSLAENGAEGVERVKIEPFDLVLMDIQMPVMDGYRATQAIRQFNPQIPIIALTAAALVEDKRKALEVGMNDHLGKPFSALELYERLSAWLDCEIQPDESPAGISQVSLDEPPTDQASLSLLPAPKHKLLIVDDMPTNIKILANLLKDQYVIQVANKGAKAIEIASGQEPPDLILLDIMMPDMDGYEVCRTLKNNPATSAIPIIFISALDEVSDEAKGLNLGAVDYIAKPFHPDIVKARVGSHMSLKVKTDLLEKMSHIDGLTQVANRRSFDQQLQREMKRANRNHQPLGLILLDIDFFKSYNDHYGHGKGDECLIKVAAALQKVICRPGDLFARYGGEEFVALLPETDAEGVVRMAQLMRTAVNSLALQHDYSSIAEHITISVGGAVKQPDETQAETLLDRADKALYHAKAAGRDQIHIDSE